MPLFVLLACLMSCVALSAASGAAASSGPTAVSTVVKLKLEGAEDLSETLRILVPLSKAKGTELQQLRSTPADYSRTYRKRLEKVFREDSVLSGIQVRNLTANLSALPDVRISERVVTIEASTGYPTFWKVNERDGSLEADPLRIGPDQQLNLIVDASLRGVDAAAPFPVADDGNGKLRWRFAGARSPALSVVLDSPLSPQREGEFRKEALGFLVEGVPFLLFLILLVKGRSPARRMTTLSLSMLAASGCVLAFGCASYYLMVEQQILSYGVGVTIVGNSASGEFARSFAPIVGLSIFAGFGYRDSRRRILTFLLVIVGGLIAAGSIAGNSFELGLGSLQLSIDSYRLLALSAFAMLLWLVIWGVIAWGERIYEVGAPLRTGPGLRSGQRLAIAALVFIPAILQFLVVTRGWSDVNTFVDASETWGEALDSIIGAVPIVLANVSIGLASTLLGVALTVWVWRLRLDGGLAFGARWECVAIGLLVGTVVTGLTGRIDGYPAPLPFLISILSVSVAVSVLARQPRAQLAREEISAEESDALLDRWLRLAHLSDRELQDEPGEEPSPEEWRRRRLQMLDEPRLEPISTEDRPREMLTLGLSEGRTSQQRLALLLRRGWWIVAIPALYSAVVLLQERSETSFSSDQPFGLLFLIASVLNQSSMWMIAASCFVLVLPIIPGRVGALKGLLAGLYVGLPWLLAHPLQGDETGLRTTLFIPAVLTLMFTSIGFLFDYRTIRRRHEGVRQMAEIYSVTSLRTAALSLIPLAILLAGVIQGLASGQGANALVDAASSFAGLPEGR